MGGDRALLPHLQGAAESSRTSITLACEHGHTLRKMPTAAPPSPAAPHRYRGADAFSNWGMISYCYPQRPGIRAALDKFLGDVGFGAVYCFLLRLKCVAPQPQFRVLARRCGAGSAALHQSAVWNADTSQSTPCFSLLPPWFFLIHDIAKKGLLSPHGGLTFQPGWQSTFSSQYCSPPVTSAPQS